MSESMAGVTFLAFGNGSPDVFSTFSAMNSNAASLAIGELIGAAGFITAVVAGSMAVIRPFKVAKKSFIRDISFFIVATCFTMVFLGNGRLDFWECAVMVGFYGFYVFTVFVWHWWLGRRRHAREKVNAARSNFSYPGSEEVEAVEEYHDDDDASTVRPTTSTSASNLDFDDMERGNQTYNDEYDNLDDDQLRDKWMGELSSNMRLSRIPTGDRRTANPIRPSLVGALEFQAVLSALQKNSTSQAAPGNPRRYSDEPHYTTAQQQEAPSETAHPQGVPTTIEASLEEFKRQASNVSRIRPARFGFGNRARAVSVNDAVNLRLDPSSLKKLQIGSLLDAPNEAHEDDDILQSSSSAAGGLCLTLPSPALPISSGDDERSNRPDERSSLFPSKTPTLIASPRGRPKLAPKGSNGSALNRSFTDAFHTLRSLPVTYRSSPVVSPKQSPFIPFRDESVPRETQRLQEIDLPTPSAELESFCPKNSVEDDIDQHWGWYPYKALPSPLTVLRTLFPTLCSWREKTWWAKMLSIASAPSIFVLTMTLPVVDLTPEVDEKTASAMPVASGSPSLVSAESHRRGSIATPAIWTREMSRRMSHPDLPFEVAVAEPMGAASPSHWNRWLTVIHCFTAPYFVTVILWLNLAGEGASARSLIKPSLYSLLVSLIALLIILLTTIPSRAPRWHFLLCFVGFVVAVAWISTIADQTVSVLKAIGVILNISEAVLGLTIFAVGASLGDLVSDISIARLGFPVMAMSACIAGPLMNILLGIGLSGIYTSWNGADARHRKHPDRPVKYKPYLLDISTTLMISAVTLLITLLVLLIVVPLNGWMMDRKVGVGLIALWSIGTVVNLIVELTGLGTTV